MTARLCTHPCDRDAYAATHADLCEQLADALAQLSQARAQLAQAQGRVAGLQDALQQARDDKQVYYDLYTDLHAERAKR